jgi:hypothetical protein
LLDFVAMAHHRATSQSTTVVQQIHGYCSEQRTLSAAGCTDEGNPRRFYDRKCISETFGTSLLADGAGRFTWGASSGQAQRSPDDLMTLMKHHTDDPQIAVSRFCF